MSNPSFAALLRPSNEVPAVPLPPPCKTIVKIADLTYAPPKEDGKNPYMNVRLVYGGPHPDSGYDASDINPADYDTLFHKLFMGNARSNRETAEFFIACGPDAAALAPVVEIADAPDGYGVNPALVELVKGREVVCDVKHAVNKLFNKPEARLVNFTAL